MGASYLWKIFSFKRANRSDRIGGLGLNGVFYWMISLDSLQEWVNDGGYVVDNSDQEYTLAEFIDFVGNCFQILNDAGPSGEFANA